MFRKAIPYVLLLAGAVILLHELYYPSPFPMPVYVRPEFSESYQRPYHHWSPPVRDPRQVPTKR